MVILDKGTAIRTMALLVALTNQILVMFGKSPLPFSSEQTEQFVSTGFTFLTSISAWFKNNYVTETGNKQKKLLEEHGLTKNTRR